MLVGKQGKIQLPSVHVVGESAGLLSPGSPVEEFVDADGVGEGLQWWWEEEESHHGANSVAEKVWVQRS